MGANIGHEIGNWVHARRRTIRSKRLSWSVPVTGTAGVVTVKHLTISITVAWAAVVEDTRAGMPRTRADAAAASAAPAAAFPRRRPRRLPPFRGGGRGGCRLGGAAAAAAAASA